MIRLDAVVALAAVLTADGAVPLASGLEGAAADEAAHALGYLAARSRVDRAAALAAALRDPPSRLAADRGGRHAVLDRFWRDLPAWSRTRIARTRRSEPTHTPIRNRSVALRHAK